MPARHASTCAIDLTPKAEPRIVRALESVQLRSET